MKKPCTFDVEKRTQMSIVTKLKKCKGTVMKKKNHSYSVTAIRIKISQLTETTEATGKTKSASTRMNFLTEITTREKVGEKRHLRRV